MSGGSLMDVHMVYVWCTYGACLVYMWYLTTCLTDAWWELTSYNMKK